MSQRISLPRPVLAPIGAPRILNHLPGPAALVAMLLTVVIVLAAAAELRTSALQSRLFSWAAAHLTYSVAPGPNRQQVPAARGPFDARRGYSAIPEMQHRLDARGFHVVEQARFSPALSMAARIGLTPPQRPPAVAGLVIRGRDGAVLYDASAAQHQFSRYEDIPPLVVEGLLFIENRQLRRPMGPNSNPAVDWGRLASATVLSAGHRVGLPLSFQGGSTLAIQMEKFRHSEGGRTQSVGEKFRQVLSASLAAYQNGPNTADEQHEIVLEYLNSLPLAATPEYGEVNGLGNGLWAWFGRDPDQVMAAFSSSDSSRQADAFKHTLALVAAVRAPTAYLRRDPAALERRVDFYVDQLAREGVISPGFADRVKAVPLEFAPERRTARVPFGQRKSIDRVRRELMTLLGVHDLYALDRLHLEVETTLDASVQDTVTRLFRDLGDTAFVARRGLKAPRMLATGAPDRVVYSLKLVEHAPDGERLIAQLDNLDRPLDVNDGVRLELGSTAKLRTMAHYLEVVGLIRRELSGLDAEALASRARDADPITAWTAAQLIENHDLPLDTLMQRAMDRRYSASPYEPFFTGGGMHVFHNFEPDDDGLILPLREAAVRSTNLVFLRLMRDLVRYHEARLPYDIHRVMDDPEDFTRNLMLQETADQESKDELRRAYREYRDRQSVDIPLALLGPTASPHELSALFYAWSLGDGSVDSLRAWLRSFAADPDSAEVERLAGVYGNPKFTVADYGYLLDVHPLTVWCAGELFRHPGEPWDEVEDKSGAARRAASAWLLDTRNRHAQDLRLRSRIERDAFVRMTGYWRGLGFPFTRLVPSLATAIGSSADRPEALATLMGILVNEGVWRQESVVRRLRFASGTPYHTVADARVAQGQRVLAAAAARTLRDVLHQVVERGTAVRLRGAFEHPDGTPIAIGGKTGSGDNRIKRFGRGGEVLESRAVSRTATFAFYLGDRYYGVLTASVSGAQAEHYQFTSTLALEVLRILAPALSARLWPGESRPAATVADSDSLAAPATGPRVATAPRPESESTGLRAPRARTAVAWVRPAGTLGAR